MYTDSDTSSRFSPPLGQPLVNTRHRDAVPAGVSLNLDALAVEMLVGAVRGDNRQIALRPRPKPLLDGADPGMLSRLDVIE